ncbi:MULTISPECIES: helix-turn-helix domain-containing protein [unclassified Pseudomonas]|nr:MULTISPECIES: helix-turn-helix domain-containing protein [unclassified Pseudomonas]
MWLQDHLTEQVRMTDLAQLLAISERTLIRRFRKVLEQAPLTYLQNLRISTARVLLESGDLSIEKIIHYVGYSDIRTFYRLFRKRVGFTPGAYRARFQSLTRT